MPSYHLILKKVWLIFSLITCPTELFVPVFLFFYTGITDLILLYLFGLPISGIAFSCCILIFRVRNRKNPWYGGPEVVEHKLQSSVSSYTLLIIVLVIILVPTVLYIFAINIPILSEMLTGIIVLTLVTLQFMTFFFASSKLSVTTEFYLENGKIHAHSSENYPFPGYRFKREWFFPPNSDGVLELSMYVEKERRREGFTHYTHVNFVTREEASDLAQNFHNPHFSVCLYMQNIPHHRLQRYLITQELTFTELQDFLTVLQHHGAIAIIKEQDYLAKYNVRSDTMLKIQKV